MLKFVIHWKHLLHFLMAQTVSWNSSSLSSWGNETDTERQKQKKCLKLNSIMSALIYRGNYGIFFPSYGIMVNKTQKKACIIVSNSHIKGYHTEKRSMYDV